jgi:hypothetical protein
MKSTERCDICGFHGGEDSRRGVLSCDAIFRLKRWRQRSPQKRLYPAASQLRIFRLKSYKNQVKVSNYCEVIAFNVTYFLSRVNSIW